MEPCEDLEMILEEHSAKLRESEKRYHDLVENLNEAIYAVDQNGVITYVSSVIERLIGYKPTEIIGRRFTEFVHRDDLPVVAESLERAKSGQPNSQEYRFVTKSGETLWGWTSSRPVIADNGVIGLQGILVNITERKDAEKSLRLLEDGFRNSLDNSPLGIHILTADGETLYSNKALLDIYGYSSIDELRATPVSQRHTVESYAKHRIRIERRRLGLPVPTTYEISIRRTDGEVRNLQVFRKEVIWGGKARYQAIYQDITELKLVEKKLQEKEARLAEAQEIGHLGSWEWDISTNEMEWSDEQYRVLGLAPQQSKPSYDTFLKCVHPEDKEFVEESIHEAISKIQPLNVTFNIVRPDGSQRFVHVVGRLITDRLNRPQRMIGTIHDITEHKEAEEELRALSQRLVGLQEQERQSIARELHDDIAQSLGFLKLILDGQTTTTIKPDLSQAVTIVDELITKVRDLSLNLRPRILDDLGLVPALLWYFGRYSAQTGIAVDFKHHKVNPRLSARVSTAIYRVIQEALSNVARHAGVRKVMVQLEGHPRELKISVKDKGRGFDLGSLAFSSNGINMMRERIRMLGGKFEIDSIPGKGTHISLRVPIPTVKRGNKKKS